MRAREGLQRGWVLLRLSGLRHLFGRRRRAVLTVAGIAASVSLVVAISVINETLRSAIDSTARGLAGRATLEVVPFSSDRLQPGMVRKIDRVPGTTAVVPISRRTTVLRAGSTARRTIVFGVPGNLRELFPDGLGELSQQLTAPRFREGMLLSEELARSLDAASGGRVGVRTLGGSRSSPVAGTFAHSPFAAVNGGSFALVSLDQAERLFDQRNKPSLVYLTTDQGRPLAELEERLQRRLGPTAVVQEPAGSAGAYQRTFDSIASVSEQARGVAFLVALFLILNTMSMALAERRREMTLLALGGAGRFSIMAAFIAESALLGAIGGAFGVLGGVALGRVLIQQAADSYMVLPFVTSGPLQVSSVSILAGVGSGIFIAIAGALLPARRILRVRPIEALQPEGSYEWNRGRVQSRAPMAAAGSLCLLGVVAVAILVPLAAKPWLLGMVFVMALVGAALLLPTLVPAGVSLLRYVYRSLFGMVGRLAADSLSRNPSRAIITAGVLALSASVVVAVGSVIGSYGREVDRAASAWYLAPLYVNAPGSLGYQSDQPLPASLGKALEHVPGVEAAYPLRFGLVDNDGTRVLVYAMPVTQAAKAGDRVTEGVGISQQAFRRALSRGEVVISRYLAQQHDLDVGEPLNRAGVPGVAGTLRVGGFFNDIAPFDSLYLDWSQYRRLAGDDRANRFAIMTEPGAAEGTARRLLRYLAGHDIPASVHSRQHLREEITSSIGGLFSLAQGIQVAALLIAGLVVLNTMLTVTLERRREFGIQRTAGMSRGQLAASVILEAVAVCTIGAACAVALGVGLGYLMTLQIEGQLAWEMTYVPATATALAAVGAMLVVGAAAAVYPSWAATRQRLIELVRFE